jgi:hypothetical protein
MTCKERLHQLIEALPEHKAEQMLKPLEDYARSLNGGDPQQDMPLLSAENEEPTDVAALFAFLTRSLALLPKKMQGGFQPIWLKIWIIISMVPQNEPRSHEIHFRGHIFLCKPAFPSG